MNHWYVFWTDLVILIPILYLWFTGSVILIHSLLKKPVDKDHFYLNLVMFTFLHHSDPTIPHYRKPAWSFLRGAAATVDRPLLGWMGRFFFHNISHDHVAHRMSLSLKMIISDAFIYIHMFSFTDFFLRAPFCEFIRSHWHDLWAEDFLFICRQWTRNYQSHKKRTKRRLQLWFNGNKFLTPSSILFHLISKFVFLLIVKLAISFLAIVLRSLPLVYAMSIHRGRRWYYIL